MEKLIIGAIVASWIIGIIVIIITERHLIMVCLVSFIAILLYIIKEQFEVNN
ncbi:hypothetical protein ACNSOL_12145 (plasmid) [Aliarcobacter lanthieri]|uniref:hypothetical protein n=1 Tax=Aliarcobacter lanthieri TaxID=1355374 RepID=UPI003AAE27A0